ncbi:tRNA(His) guanylyltransferase Thg1 family protein [Cystobacter ferrugineus]|uniref:tRNA(His) guanylyltransferase n=1 Tax=Cystobacter ferrugineus TaxID=83449 RepID=A0A1L9BHA0_9BACT|nr:tRNA(His) guanylyltransferase Thg1 family protein [Cystobacter ferrugineus]OJH41664.1 tRNA 5'-guanylyltransferase [Cystobacter ferrugineus]
MDPNDFESRMREGEFFHSLRLLRGAWCVLRVDGRGFSRFTETHYDKPFDVRMHEQMVRTASALMEELQGIYAYTESDEISILFRPEWSLYDREVEKLVSLSAGLASATFTHAAGVPAVFDSRVWLGVNEDAVLDYFRWRQSDATRCALHGWCYWTLRKEGQSAAQASRLLHGQSVGFKNELLFQRGINFNELPLWQRRGSGVVWEQYEKQGVNPVTGQTVRSTRRRLRVDQELPMKEAYDAYVRERMCSGP